MGKKKPPPEPDQAALDNADVLTCLNKWGDAQQLLHDISHEIDATNARLRQLRRRLMEANWDASVRWRALRRAQGYPVD